MVPHVGARRAQMSEDVNAGAFGKHLKVSLGDLKQKATAKT